MAAVVGWTDWDELCAASPEQDGGAKTCANSLGTLLHSDGAISHHFLDMISWGGVGGRRREGGGEGGRGEEFPRLYDGEMVQDDDGGLRVGGWVHLMGGEV